MSQTATNQADTGDGVPGDLPTDLTQFQVHCLQAVSGMDQPHGLAIKERLEPYYSKDVHHGQLYPSLDTLVEKGLMEKGEADKRTNYYVLTRRGERVLEGKQTAEDFLEGPA